MQIDWIAVKDMLPPEPIKPVENLAKIINGLEEYLVTIEGAVKATISVMVSGGMQLHKTFIRWWHGTDYQKHIKGEKTPQRKNVKLGSCGLYPFGISRLSQ